MEEESRVEPIRESLVDLFHFNLSASWNLLLPQSESRRVMWFVYRGLRSRRKGINNLTFDLHEVITFDGCAENENELKKIAQLLEYQNETPEQDQYVLKEIHDRLPTLQTAFVE